VLEHIVMCINLSRSGGKKQSEHDLSSGVRIGKCVLFKSTNGPHFRLRIISVQQESCIRTKQEG
jgi:hypothetical protein